MPASWLLALIPVMFTYSGWNAAAYVAEEVREPGRNVPLALALGTGAVIVIYLLLNAVYLYVLPTTELAQVKGSVLDVIADRLLGSAAGNVMGVVSIISLLASISAMTFAGPRVYFAMARDGLFFRRASTVHPRYRTPASAIIGQRCGSPCSCCSQRPIRSNLHRFRDHPVLGAAVVAVFVLRKKHLKRSVRSKPSVPRAPAIYRSRARRSWSTPDSCAGPDGAAR